MVVDYTSNANDSASDSREQIIIQNIVANFIASLEQHEAYFFAEIEKKRGETNQSLENSIHTILLSDENQYMQDTESYQKYKSFTITLDFAIDQYVTYIKNRFIKAQEEKTQQNIYKELTENDIEAYKNEISVTAQGLIDQYFFEQDIAKTINESEKKKYKQQARDIFLVNHKSEIDSGILDIKRISNYLPYL